MQPGQDEGVCSLMGISLERIDFIHRKPARKYNCVYAMRFKICHFRLS